MPWTCKGCEETIEDAFDECWSCGTDRDGSPPEDESLFINTGVSASEGEPADPYARSSVSDENFAAPEHANSPGRTVVPGHAPTRLETRKANADRRVAIRAARRYSDAYVVARAMTGWATVLKIIGSVGALVVFAAVTTVGGDLGQASGATPKIVGFLCGLLVWAVFYGIGVVVAAQGQMLKASVDAAVHSSPFLTDRQRVEVMSL